MTVKPLPGDRSEVVVTGTQKAMGIGREFFNFTISEIDNDIFVGETGFFAILPCLAVALEFPISRYPHDKADIGFILTCMNIIGSP